MGGGAVPSERGPFAGHQGRFLTGRTVLTSDDKDSKIPRLFLPVVDDDVIRYQECQLLVYHAILSTVCLVIPIGVTIDADLMHQLDAHMGTPLTNMSADLLDVFGTSRHDASAGQQLTLIPSSSSVIQEATSALNTSSSSTASHKRLSQLTTSPSLSSLKVKEVNI